MARTGSCWVRTRSPELLLASLKDRRGPRFRQTRRHFTARIARAMWANIAPVRYRTGRQHADPAAGTQLLPGRTTAHADPQAARSPDVDVWNCTSTKPDLLNAYVSRSIWARRATARFTASDWPKPVLLRQTLTELEPQETALLVARSFVVHPGTTRDAIRERTRKPPRHGAGPDGYSSASFQKLRPAESDTARPRRTRGKPRPSRATTRPSWIWCAAGCTPTTREDDLLSAGLRIMTTLDPRIQALAEQRLKEGLDELGNQPQAQAWLTGRRDRGHPAPRPPTSLAIGGRPRRPYTGCRTARGCAAQHPPRYRQDLEPAKLRSPVSRPGAGNSGARGVLNTPTVRIGMDVDSKKSPACSSRWA